MLIEKVLERGEGWGRYKHLNVINIKNWESIPLNCVTY